MRTFHLLKTPDILLANDTAYWDCYHLETAVSFG
jgi:hypothetical protein